MRIVVVGGGGREHAIGWKLRQSPRIETVIGVPGNAGWQQVGPVWTDVDPGEHDAFAARLKDANIDLVIVGPEAPLVDGLADALRGHGLAVVGPGAAGARLEGSKVHAKEFMQRHGIPTAPFAVFTDPAEAKAHVQAEGAPIVIKADGLAAGKGVVVATTVAEAEAAIDRMLTAGEFGAAGRRVLIEACLAGEEVSMLALTDGETVVPLLPSQDHKRVFDHDQGPNTGGMGAYAPTSAVDDAQLAVIREQVLDRTLAGLKDDGVDFRGVLYCGLMLVDGKPYVLEYNVRFGDPECQPLLMHMASDLLPLLEATAHGTLAAAPAPEWHSGVSLCVVMASGGYPGAYNKGVPIPGLRSTDADDRVVFHAGTAMGEVPGGVDVVTAGGRVLGVTARGADVAAAREAAYAGVEALRWPGVHYRTDIGIRELERGLGVGRTE